MNPTGLPGVHCLCGACEVGTIPSDTGKLKRNPQHKEIQKKNSGDADDINHVYEPDTTLIQSTGDTRGHQDANTPPSAI